MPWGIRYVAAGCQRSRNELIDKVGVAGVIKSGKHCRRVELGRVFELVQELRGTGTGLAGVTVGDKEGTIFLPRPGDERIEIGGSLQGDRAVVVNGGLGPENGIKRLMGIPEGRRQGCPTGQGDGAAQVFPALG